MDEVCPTLLSDYLEKITGDIYLTLGEFCRENYVSIRRYYTDRDGNLRPKKEGAAPTLGQFAILVDSMSEIESCYWAFEEGLSVSPFVQYVGPWKLSIDIFGDFLIWKHYYDQTKNLLMPLNKGISFPLSYYRQLAREIYHLLERYPTLKQALPCYKVRIPESRRATTATRSTATNQIPTNSFRSKVSRTITDCYLSQKIFSGNHIRTIFIYSCRHFVEFCFIIRDCIQ